MTFIMAGLATFAEVASASGDSRRATRLLGAIERRAELLGYSGSQRLRLEAEAHRGELRIRARSRETLGEAAFEAELAAGRALALDEAVAYALERER